MEWKMEDVGMGRKGRGSKMERGGHPSWRGRLSFDAEGDGRSCRWPLLYNRLDGVTD